MSQPEKTRITPLEDKLIFMREFIREFENTGSCFATSPYAARALSAPILERSGPRRILELGPGTGSVTVQILEYMEDGDELAICEINPRFMQALKTRLAELPSFQRHKNRITFYECGAQDLPVAIGPFDIVVCALPFLNFPFDLTKQIFARIQALSSSQTVMTYYEYIGLREISRIIPAPERKERVKLLEQFHQSMKNTWNISRTKVWRNLLPIFVYRIEMQTSSAMAAA